MEDIYDKFEDNLNVEKIPNSTAKEHPWQNVRYKNNGRHSNCKNSQSLRRQQRLKDQKINRQEQINKIRQVSVSPIKMENKQHLYKERRKEFSDKLMLSEWMVEVPDDLEKEWTMIPCPIGKRNLIVAHRGKTHCFAKNGHHMFAFKSLLPGGLYTVSDSYKDCTIIDCIYDSLKKTFYILDVIKWRSHAVTDSEREFRYYWLQTKYSETCNLDKISKDNEYCFKIIPEFKADIISMKKALSTSYEYEIDGILFYDKKGHYFEGTTPLCLWLKCYMMTELLDVEVHPHHLKSTPISYENFKLHAIKLRKNKSIEKELMEM